LQWVMYYYFTGVESWTWFYDYHYPPMTSDLRGIAQSSFDFKLRQPFRSYEQLIGVLPAASKDHIPTAYHVRQKTNIPPFLNC
ncbi:hypothetical protein GG344DRAFT_47830, partial [Lentinula edodes]